MDLLLYFVLIMNILTFALFGIDKLKAKKDRWRISEKTLLLMGLFFGSAGQLAGMKFFHHKTQKWYFRVSGWLFLILHIVFLFIYYTKWKFL